MEKVIQLIPECKDGGSPDEIIVCGGIFLQSRFNFWEEYGYMWAGIKNIPSRRRNNIEKIWCDSKANAVYTITFRTGTDPLFAKTLADMFSQGVIQDLNGLGGHNGIYIENCEYCVDPYWAE